MQKRISVIAGFLVVALFISLAACSSGKEKTVFDDIKLSPAARMELPDGSRIYVDSEIMSLRSFAEMNIQAATLEPADSEDDWLYRIVWNPPEKVSGIDEVTVSFHKDYIRINAEYYLPKEGVPYDSILEWVEGKFKYFMK